VALKAAVSPDAGVRRRLRQRPGDDGLLTLYCPIRGDLVRMEAIMGGVARASGHMIRPMARHLLRRPGKRIRGALVLFAAKAGNAPRRSDAAHRIDAPWLAAAAEMLHTASLIHDDIVDGASLRRGQPSLHARWGTHRAVLMGDFLLAWNFSELARRFPVEVVRVLLRAAKTACDGEIEETGMAYRADLTEPQYLRIAAKKTGALTSAACEAGAILGGASPAVRSALRRYGESFGTAFQLVDDALDFTAHTGEVGKPVGRDMVEGRFTMPVLSLRRILRGAERRRLYSLLTPPSLSNGGARRVVELVRSRGGVACALERAGAYAARARAALRGVPPAAAEPLAALADYVVRRRR